MDLNGRDALMMCRVRRLVASAMVMTFLLVQMMAPGGDLVSGTVPDVVILYPVEGETYRGTETIELNASESFDPDGKEVIVFWKDNIDGSLGYGFVLYVHLSVGVHTITCEVTDDDNEKASATRQVTVLGLEKPIAKLESDKTVAQVFEIITFTGSKSYDPDFGVTDYYFDFGDSYNTGWIKSTTATHSYSLIGTYTIGLTVKDNDGLTNTMNITVTIKSKPRVDDNTNDTNIFMVALVAILVIIVVVILVVWNRMRVRGNREEEKELAQRMRDPRAYRPRYEPEDVVRRPPEGGQGRKVRVPVVKDEAYRSTSPRKVRAPAQRKSGRP